MADRIESFKDTRTAILLIVVLLWSTVIFCRLVQKQVIEHDDYVKQAVRLQQGKRTLQAPRGVIYDRHLNELAVDVTLSTIIAEPRLVTDIPGTAKKLASILGMNPAGLATKMSNPARRNYLVVQRRIKDDEKLAIMASLLDWPPSEVIEGLQYQQLSPQEKKLRRTQALVADKSPKDPVTELKKNGFYFEDEPVRTYPSDELACHVLGFVN
ncbi:MAG: hypothetical protein LBP68_00675, partial [Acidobacteriota bacterium]|nr:hypothetical protein [Acidobacteriota bacterium]